MRRWLTLLLAACAAAPTETELPAAPADGWVLVDATVLGGGPELVIEGATIGAQASAGAERLSLSGHWVVPAFIDSHVHLAYLPQGPALAAGGVAGAVDWAAPLRALRADPSGPDVVWSGPMITAPDGYPLSSWGADGYGLGVTTPEEASAAVGTLVEAGAQVIKIPVPTRGRDLSDEVLGAAVQAAHARGLKVGAHAVRPEHAERAARLDADILVHAPSGPLSDEAVAHWRSRYLVPTLSAFGGGEATRQLREAGTTILYGTDFGNTSALGISEAEVRGMMAAGMDGEAILTAGTTAPAEAFGFADLGHLRPGAQASLLVVDADPRVDPTVLSRPVAVLHRGRLVAGGWP